MTLRDAAHTAYLDALDAEDRQRKRKLKEMFTRASFRAKHVLGIPNDLVWQGADARLGVYTSLDGVKIQAIQEDETIDLYAYVFTHDDGMCWQIFSSLEQLGRLLAEDEEGERRPQNNRLCDSPNCFKSAKHGTIWCQEHAASGEPDHGHPGGAGGTLESDISAGTSDSSGRGS